MIRAVVAALAVSAGLLVSAPVAGADPDEAFAEQ